MSQASKARPLKRKKKNAIGCKKEDQGRECSWRGGQQVGGAEAEVKPTYTPFPTPKDDPTTRPGEGVKRGGHEPWPNWRGGPQCGEGQSPPLIKATRPLSHSSGLECGSGCPFPRICTQWEAQTLGQTPLAPHLECNTHQLPPLPTGRSRYALMP